MPSKSPPKSMSPTSTNRSPRHRLVGVPDSDFEAVLLQEPSLVGETYVEAWLVVVLALQELV